MESDDEFKDCIEDQLEDQIDSTKENTPNQGKIDEQQPNQDSQDLADLDFVMVGDMGSKIFTDDDGFEFEIPRKWTFEEIFQFESEEIRKEVWDFTDLRNTQITDDMMSYEPQEVYMKYGKCPQRLILYTEEGLSEEETKGLKDMMLWCKERNLKVPDTKQECFRFLQGKKYVN